MKILQIHKFFDYRGGPEFYIPELMSHLVSAGHECHIFATRSDNDRPTLDRDYFVTRHAYDKREGVLKDAYKAVNFVWNREAASSLERMIADVKPDVIHLHNVYHHLSTSILAVIRNAGIPCVQTLHDYKLACPNYMMFTQGAVCERCKGGHYYQAIKHQCLSQGKMPNLLAAFEIAVSKARQSYERTVSVFIAPSHFMQDKMVEWGEPPGKFVYLPNPVAEASLTNDELRDTGNYAFVGRLYANKGVETAIRAAASAGVKLDVVGEGPERASLERLASQLAPERIKFFGFKVGEELDAIRRTARAFIVPSVWYENAPLVVLEAMSLGLPVIGSEIGGIPELVKHNETGLLAKPGVVDDWILAFKNMDAKSSAERKKMGDAGRMFVKKNMDWNEHVQKMLQLYRDVGKK